MMNVIKLNDDIFEVRKAIFSGYLSEGDLSWNFRIFGEIGNRESEGCKWEPNVYSESIFALKNRRFVDLDELFATECFWTEACNKVEEDDEGNLYVFEHEPVTNGLIRFNRTEKNHVDIEFVGKSFVFNDPVEITANAHAEIIGIYTDYMVEEEAKNALSDFTSHEKFEYYKVDEDDSIFKLV